MSYNLNYHAIRKRTKTSSRRATRSNSKNIIREENTQEREQTAERRISKDVDNSQTIQYIQGRHSHQHRRNTHIPQSITINYRNNCKTNIEVAKHPSRYRNQYGQ